MKSLNFRAIHGDSSCGAFLSIDIYINLKIDRHKGIFIWYTFPLFPSYGTFPPFRDINALVCFGSSSIGVIKVDIYTEQWRYKIM